MILLYTKNSKYFSNKAVHLFKRVCTLCGILSVRGATAGLSFLPLTLPEFNLINIRQLKDNKMKKLFLVLAALVSLLSAESVFAAETDFVYSASWNSLYGYNFPNNKYKHQDNRDRFVNILNAELGLETSFSSDYFLGLYADFAWGINKRQYNYNNGLWGQEIYAVFDNPYGRVMLGETSNVAAQFHVGAPQAGYFGLNDSEVVNFMANPNWVKTKHNTAYKTLNSTSANTDGTAPKISYITPEINNFIFGFSYIPDSYSRSGLLNKFAPYADDSGYVAALHYTADLNFVELEAFAGYGIYNQDDRDMSAGLKVYRGNWSIGGSWRKTYVDDGDYPIRKQAGSRTEALFDNYREGQTWDIGVGYEFGPYQVSLSYFNSKADNSDNKDEIVLLSNSFQINKNIEVYLAGAHVDFQGDKHFSDEANKGWAAMTGFSLKF